jgi:hypothetical protein
LKVPTVRAAQPRLTGAFLVLSIGLIVVAKFMPRQWAEQAKTVMAGESGRLYGVNTQILVFLVLDVILLALAMVRFRLLV